MSDAAARPRTAPLLRSTALRVSRFWLYVLARWSSRCCRCCSPDSTGSTNLIGLRDQRAARARARLHPRLCGPAQSRAVRLLRHRRLRLDLADHAARHAVLASVRVRRRARRRVGNAAVAVRRAAARPLPRDRVARLRGDHRIRSCSTGSASPRDRSASTPSSRRPRWPCPGCRRSTSPTWSRCSTWSPDSRCSPICCSINWCARRSARR